MQTKLLIDGELVAGEGEALPVVDPSTGSELTRATEVSFEQLDAVVRSSAEAFESLSR